jgi:hypothetical protein
VRSYVKTRGKQREPKEKPRIGGFVLADARLPGHQAVASSKQNHLLTELLHRA